MLYLIHRYFVFMTNESDVRTTELRTEYLFLVVYFNSVIKRVKHCCCTLTLLLKSTLNANLTTNNCFFTNDDWQRGRFENFESDHQYESNLESDVRFEIESNHEASQQWSNYEGGWGGLAPLKDRAATWKHLVWEGTRGPLKGPPPETTRQHNCNISISF